MTEPYYSDDLMTLHHGTAAAVAAHLATASIRTIVTSPPYYGLRDYGHEDQLGAESSVQEYVDNLVATFEALRPALADDGTLWLNLGDSYTGSWGAQGRKADGEAGIHSKVVSARQYAPGASRTGSRRDGEPPVKNLLGVPWRVAFAMQDAGWILRSDIIWAKPNPMPESVTDRPTKAHEYLFLFAKRPKYYYDAEAIAEPVTQSTIDRVSQRGYAEQDGSGRAHGTGKTNGNMKAYGPRWADGSRIRPTADAAYGPEGTRNRRTVWDVATVAFSEAHFATYPPELIRPCILAGSARGDTVLDPFSGSGTTGMVATQEGRRYVGIDVNADYLDLSLRTRFASPVLDMTGGAA